jgi:RNA 3'-terminal phosphate cyclase (ATP)
MTAQPPHQAVTIDGSQGEGGGQILRNGIAYCCIFRRSLRIHRIRAKRRQPGLKRQHLTGLELCAEIGGGVLEGAELYNTEIVYHPPSDGSASCCTAREFTGAVDTAGSICL